MPRSLAIAAKPLVGAEAFASRSRRRSSCIRRRASRASSAEPPSTACHGSVPGSGSLRLSPAEPERTPRASVSASWSTARCTLCSVSSSACGPLCVAGNGRGVPSCGPAGGPGGLGGGPGGVALGCALGGGPGGMGWLRPGPSPNRGPGGPGGPGGPRGPGIRRGAEPGVPGGPGGTVPGGPGGPEPGGPGGRGGPLGGPGGRGGGPGGLPRP
mmetsp:Transcript_42656/g.101279  ORF Transcript_42656/g.101279 Transcript_42656/m.101279 type:complete len:213 (+) Transcript_42656:1348-1986(+)